MARFTGAAGGDFPERMHQLVAEVGHGDLEARCDVDQVYAHFQEVHDEFNHPRGGQSHALEAAIFSTYVESLEQIAGGVLTGELRLDVAMAAERIAEKYAELAPVEITNLRRSGHPTASDDGEVYYDRAPEQHRLSDEEIAALDAARNLTNPHHWYGSYYALRR